MIHSRDFRPVTLADRDLFLRYAALYPPCHSDNTFTNMVCWNHYAHYTFAEIGRSLLVASTIDGRTSYRPPVGPRDPVLLHDVMVLATRSGDKRPFSLIDPDTRDWIAGLYPGIHFVEDRDYFEYIYRTEDLADLAGRKYLTMRRQLHRFMRTCMPAVDTIRQENLQETREFLIEWCEWKNCEGETFLAAEKEAVFYAIDHFLELGLSGLLVRVTENGRIGAMAIYEPQNDSTAVVHFEKGLPDCEGIYRAINAETARLLRGRFSYINRESDMGVPGLREAKLRYHPDHLTEVYAVERDELVVALRRAGERTC